MNIISRKISVVTELKTNKNKDVNQFKKNKVRTPKISGVANNGLSVENLRKAGHKIAVHHYRAYYSDDVDRVIYLPSYTKYLNDRFLILQARGGYTRIALALAVNPNSSLVGFSETDSNGNIYYYSDIMYFTSHCASTDLFCYKLGVTKALDRIPNAAAKLLLNGPITDPIF